MQDTLFGELLACSKCESIKFELTDGLCGYCWDESQEPRLRTIEDRFNDFHQAHPEVFTQLVRLAREWMSVGHARLGIATLFEKLRWEWHVAGLADRDGYKLNNSYRALYARKIMAENPELDGLFETRSLATEKDH